MLDGYWAQNWMRAAAQTVAENRQSFNKLDQAIGDGDHGENLNRGFKAVVEKLDAEQTPGAVAKLTAMTLMSVVGGAAGPLYGTAFLRLATTWADTDNIDVELLAKGLTAARDGLVDRGKAQPGDKTMVDAFTAAVDAANQAVKDQDAAETALRKIATAADEAAEATIDMQAKKGRASYLGERSIGHKDPGAASTAAILHAAVTATQTS